MIGRGRSVRVHRADGTPTDIVGVITRMWTNEATNEQHAEIAAWGRRWSGLCASLRLIEPLAVIGVVP